jgi:hypothetical protein
MRSSIRRGAPLLAALGLLAATVPATVAASATPPTAETAAAPSPPALTPPTAEASPSAMTSPAPSPSRTVPSPWRPSATAARVDPTPAANPDDQDDAAAPDETPAPWALPTPPPAGAVRAFRTPEREAPPPFVAPRDEPESLDDAPLAEPLPEATRLPDRPYVGTVTFRAVAGVDVEEFDLLVIYPRAAGDFVGSGDRVDCKTDGDATLFADDRDDGMLRIVVASGRPLAFPFEVVCRFAVDVQATLYSALIAVNVTEVTTGGAHGDPSLLTVTVDAH